MQAIARDSLNMISEKEFMTTYAGLMASLSGFRTKPNMNAVKAIGRSHVGDTIRFMKGLLAIGLYLENIVNIEVVRLSASEVSVVNLVPVAMGKSLGSSMNATPARIDRAMAVKRLHAVETRYTGPIDPLSFLREAVAAISVTNTRGRRMNVPMFNRMPVAYPIMVSKMENEPNIQAAVKPMMAARVQESQV